MKGEPSNLTVDYEALMKTAQYLSTAVASLGSIISSIHSPGSVMWTIQHRLFTVITISMVTADSLLQTLLSLPSSLLDSFPL